MLDGRPDAWYADEEYGRQALAGFHPTAITALKQLPEAFGSAIRPHHVQGEYMQQHCAWGCCVGVVGAGCMELPASRAAALPYRWCAFVAFLCCCACALTHAVFSDYPAQPSSRAPHWSSWWLRRRPAPSPACT